jgi:hypothetical protein
MEYDLHNDEALDHLDLWEKGDDKRPEVVIWKYAAPGDVWVGKQIDWDNPEDKDWVFAGLHGGN